MTPKQFTLAQTSSALAIAIVGGVISLLTNHPENPQ